MSLPQAKPAGRGGSRKSLLIPLALTGLFLALGLFSRARANSHLLWTYIGVGTFFFIWQLSLFAGSGRTTRRFAWEFVAVRSHYIQALMQLCIYVYWGWYWRNVYAEAPLILSQVVFFYVFDALLTWSRGQTWRLGFGPWPIIFSTNLFMWFRDDWFVFQFLMVALGVLGKQFIRWKRDGKVTHIFNPSAFSLTIVSLVLIFTGTTDHTWGREIATLQGLPPHLYTEIFLCGLVVQYFFSVTLLTFSAAAILGLMTLAYTQLTGVYLFFDSNIPIAVFLGLHLLMTDPATTPRSSLGRIMFGSLYGVGVFVAFVVLQALHLPEFYDKLVVVPLLNLMTPLLDRLAAGKVAGKFGRWETSVGPPKMNLAYMGVWTAVFLAMLGTGFVEAPHPGATIGFWEKAAEENRPNAVGHLRYMLNDFSKRDLNDPAEQVRGTGGGSSANREQLLGALCNQVANIYAAGKFVPADPDRAAYYYQKSSELGDIDGSANVVIEYFHTNQLVTPAVIDRALTTLEQSTAATNNGRICYFIGYAYHTGHGRTLDQAKARQFFGMGAGLGDLAAEKSLAQMQFAGEGGPADHTAAAHWLQMAADARDGVSCFYLARLYHIGDGVPQDEQKASMLLQKACDLGVAPACDLIQGNRH
jgi:TPR repeat protein